MKTGVMREDSPKGFAKNRIRWYTLLVVLLIGPCIAGYFMEEQRLDGDDHEDTPMVQSVKTDQTNGIASSSLQTDWYVEELDAQRKNSIPFAERLDMAWFTPGGTILLPDIGDTGVTAQGEVKSPRMFLKPGAEDALAELGVIPDDAGMAAIELERKKLREEAEARAAKEAEVAALRAAELEKAENEGKVLIDGERLINGLGTRPIELHENPSALDPSWKDLTDFLKYDVTDWLTNMPDFCTSTDFAERLHNSAEANGWRCAYVAVEIRGHDGVYGLNAFETTDYGLVFIDSNGKINFEKPDEPHPYFDTIVDVKLGKYYIQELVFPYPTLKSWKVTLGRITRIHMVQW